MKGNSVRRRIFYQNGLLEGRECVVFEEFGTVPVQRLLACKRVAVIRVHGLQPCIHTPATGILQGRRRRNAIKRHGTGWRGESIWERQGYVIIHCGAIRWGTDKVVRRHQLDVEGDRESGFEVGVI